MEDYKIEDNQIINDFNKQNDLINNNSQGNLQLYPMTPNLRHSASVFHNNNSK